MIYSNIYSNEVIEVNHLSNTKLGRLSVRLRERWVLLGLQLIFGIATALLSIIIAVQSTSTTKLYTVILAIIAFLMVLVSVLDKIADLQLKKDAENHQLELEKTGYRALQPIMKMLDLLLKNSAHKHGMSADRFLFLPEMMTTLATGVLETELSRSTYISLTTAKNAITIENWYSSGLDARNIEKCNLSSKMQKSQILFQPDFASKVITSQEADELLGATTYDGESLIVPVHSGSQVYGLLILETQDSGIISETERLACVALARSAALLLESR